MFRKISAVIQSGLLSFFLFGSFALLAFFFMRNTAGYLTLTGILLTILAHYITALFCGYWAGYKTTEDGWVYGIFGYILWYGLYRVLYVKFLQVHATLPFPLPIKLIGFLPVMALLLFSGVIGEQKAQIEIKEGRSHHVFYPVAKRVLDLIVSALGLFILSPLMFAIALSIKLASPGPFFFHQKRIGLYGKPFELIKFRTMYAKAEEDIEKLAEFNERDDISVQLKSDPRVFPLGRFLRVISLDELPQLINVLKGDMSLIGPRPLIPLEVESFSVEESRRMEVRPGLTGWAQINGRGDVPMTSRLAMDIEYVDRQSLIFDLSILIRTLIVVFHRKGAY